MNENQPIEGFVVRTCQETPVHELKQRFQDALAESLMARFCPPGCDAYAQREALLSAFHSGLDCAQLPDAALHAIAEQLREPLIGDDAAQQRILTRITQARGMFWVGVELGRSRAEETVAAEQPVAISIALHGKNRSAM